MDTGSAISGVLFFILGIGIIANACLIAKILIKKIPTWVSLIMGLMAIAISPYINVFIPFSISEFGAASAGVISTSPFEHFVKMFYLMAFSLIGLIALFAGCFKWRELLSAEIPKILKKMITINPRNK